MSYSFVVLLASQRATAVTNVTALYAIYCFDYLCTAVMGGALVPDWAAERRPFLLGATGAIDATTLAYVYFEEEPGRRSAAKLLSRDEARRIATNSRSCRSYCAPRKLPENGHGNSR